MPRFPARGRSAVLVTALALVGTLAGSPAYAAQSPFDAGDISDDVVSPPSSPTQTVAANEVPVPAPGPWSPTATSPHVVVVSSGVQLDALPQVLGSRVILPSADSGVDTMGYGTWAAAGIFQLAPGADVTSLNVYPGGKFQQAWVMSALEWVVKQNTTAGAKPVDAVVLAFPPADYLDPISITRDARSATVYREMLDTMLDRPMETGAGTYVGSARVDSDRLAHQLGGSSAAEQTAVREFQKRAHDWRRAVAAVGTLAKAGIPVVAPAGDTGPGLQSIAGLGNLADVVTVGAATGDAGSGYALTDATASGPSLDGLAKPDLVAPITTVAVVPAGSELDRLLPAFDLDHLVDVFDGLTWAGRDATPRAWVGSSMTSATLVATALAGLHAEGVRDLATLRGALFAAAEPVAGEPVWRQGAGVLRRTPDRAFADSRPLVGAPLSLGIDRPGTAWTATAPVRNGAAGTPVTRLTHFSGYGPQGQNVTTAVDPSVGPVTTGTGGSSVRVTAAAGAPPGLYCGTTEVPLPHGASVTLNEHVPTCLVQGMELYAESRYIHDEKAENVTYELLPAVPPVVESRLHKAFELLPLDPTHLPLYLARTVEGGCKPLFGAGGYPSGLKPDEDDHKSVEDKTAVTDNETCAYFASVPPGYYDTRLFAHYGAPVEWSDPAGLAELGAPAGYQKMPMWVLPRDPGKYVGASNVAAPRDDTGAGLDYTVAGVGYRWDKTTNTWVVGPDLDNAGQRFAYGHFKRIIGTAVASRVVDLLDYDSFAGTYNAIDVEKAQLRNLQAVPGSEDLSAWRWSRSAVDKTGFEARYEPLFATSRVLPIGWAEYTMRLTTPNYLLHNSLNFKYELTDAILQIELWAGDEYVMRRLIPQGGAIVAVPVDDVTLPEHQAPWGTATGEASIGFRLKPKGAPSARLKLTVIPTTTRQNGQAIFHAGAVKLSGMSMQYDTWTNAFWPQRDFCTKKLGENETCTAKDTKPLHVLPLSANFSPRQVDGDHCRDVQRSLADPAKKVCEDWSVLVHAPSRDARLYDVRAGYADPNGDLPSVDISDDLEALGAVRYAPPPATSHNFTIAPVIDLRGKAPDSDTVRLSYPFNGVTNNRFWDDLVLPLTFVEKYDDRITIRIENNVHSDTVDPEKDIKPLAPRGRAGRAPVKPYVCYVPRSATVNEPLL